jgi:hypothetical protein
LACVLWIGKRGKADGYLVHLLRFHLSPKHLSAFFDGGSSDRKFLRSVRALKRKET